MSDEVGSMGVMRASGEVFCDSLRGVSDAPTLKTNPKTCFQVFMQAGTELALEQEYVKSTSLSREYMRWQKNVVAPEGMRVYSGNVEMKSDVKGPEHKMTELAYAMVERLMSGTAPTEEELDAEEQEIVDNIEQVSFEICFVHLMVHVLLQVMCYCTAIFYT